MKRLEIRLLGVFQAALDEGTITTFESNKVRALLAILATDPSRQHRRETLAGLLWPDWPERSAMSNLRYALADLRKNIGDREASPPFLFICYQVLHANGDPRADQILAEAYRDIQEDATRIEDEELRRSFLENLPCNREIVALWQ